jgi:hypothetical protein
VWQQIRLCLWLWQCLTKVIWHFLKNNLRFLEKQNYDVYLVPSNHVCTLCAYPQFVFVSGCRVRVYKRSSFSLILKRKNEYLNYVKETAKTPLSIALCGQLRGMLSLTSYCSYIVYSQLAFIVLFFGLYIYSGGNMGLWRIIYIP